MRRASVVVVGVAALVGAWMLPASAQPVPVLGNAAYAVHGSGFGTAEPRRIFNGGDPSGLVVRIHWQHWGAARAVGVGRTYVTMPRGGYYPGTVRIVLRAVELGDCGDGVPAYTVLQYRVQLRPGGPTQRRWHAWGSAPGGVCNFS